MLIHFANFSVNYLFSIAIYFNFVGIFFKDFVSTKCIWDWVGGGNCGWGMCGAQKFIWIICGQAFRFLLVQNFVHRWHYLERERELENFTKPHPSLLNLTKASNFEYFRMVSMLHRLCGKLHRLCGQLHRLCGQLHRLCGRLHRFCGKLHRLCGQTHF